MASPPYPFYTEDMTTSPPTPTPPSSNIPPPRILTPKDGNNTPTQEPEETPEESLWSTGMKVLVGFVVGLVVIGTVGYIVQRLQASNEEEPENVEEVGSTTPEPGTISTIPLPEPTETDTATTEPATANTKTEVLNEFEGVANLYNISLDIPAEWSVEAAPNQSVNIYDPAAPGDSTLEQSQIFIRSFNADRFLTLSTVTIHERTERTIAERPAVTYDIEKKATVASFAGQPSWRSERHEVTDIRQQDESPSTFFVIARNPDVDEAVFESVLESYATVSEEDTTANLTTQTRLLESRVYHKPFGIRITPATSPIQPERFSGYHTAIDLEFDDQNDSDIPVVAIADGTVVQSKTVDGYGGLVVVQHHDVGGRALVGIYGHLDPSSLRTTGTVKKGEQLGMLGEGFSTETDGERKHLHFGLYTGAGIDIRGYVATEGELTNWIDPLPELERLLVDGLAVLPIAVADYPRYEP